MADSGARQSQPGELGIDSALSGGDGVLQRLLDLLPDALLVFTGDRIGFVNQAAQRLFGIEDAALMNQLPMAMIHDDSVEAVRARIAMLRTGAVSAPLTGIRIVRSGGETRIVEMAGTRVEAGFGAAPLIVVLRDVTDLTKARTELAHSYAELQRVLAARDGVQESERRRIARELHDDLQQTLAAIQIGVAAAGQRIVPKPPEVQALLDKTSSLASAAIESTRRIINDLRPQMLEDLGLLPALEALVGRFRRRTGIDCRLRLSEGPGNDAPISRLVATCLYRVAQEGLSNIARHAQASEVEVRFARMSRGLILLRIADNGKGMATDQPRSAESSGLLGMRERVRAVGALLRIDSRLGEGTAIEVVVPAAIANMETALTDDEPDQGFSSEVVPPAPPNRFDPPG